jgi:hypothetical protein
MEQRTVEVSLGAYKLQTQKLTPTGLLKAYQLNRFVISSEVAPIAYHQLETELLTIAEDMGIGGILLSPFAVWKLFGFRLC